MIISIPEKKDTNHAMRTQQASILQMNIAQDNHIRNSAQVCIDFQRKQCFACLRLKETFPDWVLTDKGHFSRYLQRYWFLHSTDSLEEISFHKDVFCSYHVSLVALSLVELGEVDICYFYDVIKQYCFLDVIK